MTNSNNNNNDDVDDEDDNDDKRTNRRTNAVCVRVRLTNVVVVVILSMAKEVRQIVSLYSIGLAYIYKTLFGNKQFENGKTGGFDTLIRCAVVVAAVAATVAVDL